VDCAFETVVVFVDSRVGNPDGIVDVADLKNA
jgi:hypothetical protein